MTRPDPRLLVPVSALPFVPEGARVWGGVAGSAWIAIGDRRRGMVLCDTEPDGSARDVRCFDRSPTMLLDASAPELRDGLPARLDALPWLLRVLHPKATQIEGHAHAQYPGVLLLSIENGVMVHWRDYTKHHGTWSGTFVLDLWPDLLGLSDDEAARAVVVAAVVARPRP